MPKNQTKTRSRAKAATKSVAKSATKTATKQTEIKPAVTSHDADKLTPEQLDDKTRSSSDKPVQPPAASNTTDSVEQSKTSEAKTAADAAAKKAQTEEASKTGDEQQTATQSNQLSSSKEAVAKNPVTVKNPDPEKQTPLQTETAEDKKEPEVSGVGPDEDVQNAIAEQARKDDKAAVEAITASDTTDRIVMHLVNEINATMPTARMDLDDKAFEKIVRQEVEKVSAPRIEDRSTDAMIVSRIKTDVKTRIGEAVKQSMNKAGTERLRSARIDVAAASLSPAPVSPESLMEVAKSVPDFDDKAHLARIEDEQRRLANQASGQIDDAGDMQPERTYHFSESVSEKALAENPAARGVSFVGRLTSKPKGGSVEVAVFSDGKESGRIKQVEFSDYNVRQIDSNQAHDLSRASV